MMESNNQLVANRLKAPKKFFDWAKSTFPIYKWENKERTILSTDRKKCSEVITKRLYKNTSFTVFGGVDAFVWVGVTSKRVEFQTYKIYQSIVDGQEVFDIELYNFESYTKNGVRKVHRRYRKQYDNGLACLKPYCGPYGDCYFYESPKKTVDRIARTFLPLKYLDWENFKELGVYDSMVDMLDHVIKYRYLIEYAQKIKAAGVVKELVGRITWSYSYSSYHKHIDMRGITFKWLKKHKAVFKNSDLTISKYRRIQSIKSRFGVCVPGFEKFFGFSDERLTDEDFSCIPTSVKITRFQNWVVKNGVNASDYRDYRRMLEYVGVNFRGDRIVLPKDFKASHDEAVANYELLIAEEQASKRQKELAAKNEQYQKRLEDLMKLETTIGQYAFVVPKQLFELVEEGKALHHCVGSYTGKQAIGQTSIFFVRDKNDISKPLYTLEVHSGRIIQFRAANNAQPNNEAQKTAEHFLTFANQQGVAY